MRKLVNFAIDGAVRLFPKHMIGLARSISESAAGSNKRTVRRGMTTEYLSHVEEFASDAEIIEIAYRSGCLTEEEIHRLLTQIFRDRKLKLFESILERSIDGLEALWSYHRTCLAHYRGQAFGTDETILLQVGNAPPYLRNAFLNLAVTQFCLSGNVDALREILSGLSQKRYANLTRINWIGVFRLFRFDGQEAELIPFIKGYVNTLPVETRLNFLEVTRTELLKKHTALPENDDWREILDFFEANLSSKSPAQRSEYRRFYTGPLRRVVPQARDFMDIRLCEESRKELQSLILNAVTQKASLSLIRLGDGEAYAFAPPVINSAEPEDFDQDNRVRELIWWGQSPPHKEAEAIKYEVFDAVANADILGIPSVFRLIRDRGQPESDLGAVRSKRGLVAVLNGIEHQLPEKGRTFTEERCHHLIFDDAFLRDLSEQADKTIIVSSWKSSQIDVSELKRVSFLEISPHMKLAESGLERPLFLDYRGVVDEISRLSGPGTLVLVGGGVIGKVFVDAAKAQGGVGLDVGSIFDYAAGRKTRSILDRL